MKTSKAGLDLIKRWEGCRLTAYQDSVGVWTIGYGLTSAAGLITVGKGLTITQKQADDYLVAALAKYEAAVSKAISRTMTQAQFDAFVSLCYNIGPGAFAGSTVVKRFNAGDIAGAADAILMWNKAGGKVLKGLENRRADERALFLTPAKDAMPIPFPQPEATPSPMPKPGGLIAKWVLGIVAALLALAAAFIAKG